MTSNTFLRPKRKKQVAQHHDEKDFRDAEACMPWFIPLIYNEQEKAIIPVWLTRAVNQQNKNKHFNYCEVLACASAAAVVLA
jgi:hypothetical protein